MGAGGGEGWGVGREGGEYRHSFRFTYERSKSSRADKIIINESINKAIKK